MTCTIHNSSLDTSFSARNLGFIFDKPLAFSYQITSLSKACYYQIRQLRCIRTYLYLSTACTIATSIVHSKLVILSTIKSLSLNYPVSSRSRTLLLILSLKLLSPVISLQTYSLHWLGITGHIEYKLLSLTYKVLTTTQPPYLHNLISVQRPRSICSLSVVTLAQPPTSSSLNITDRSFCYASTCLWNQLPLPLSQPHSGTSSSISDSPIPSPITSSSSDLPICSSITPSFTPSLKPTCFTNHTISHPL